ncbi:hypothetical protein P8452_65888 [Trifolium repens]|nr:hypothetical protein P8452_65888 [Trifolium repens]
MEVHSSVVAKRLWNVLRITFFMMRKSFVSKRKMIMDINLMMKKGKVLRKSLSNLMSSHNRHHHHSSKYNGGGFMVHDYEFSCSNSPNPLFFIMSKRNKHHFTFPCINAPEVIEEEPLPCQYSLSPLEFEIENLSKGSVAIVPKTPEYTLNFSENENGQVDDEAEDFIRRFYEQLKTQSLVQLPKF